MGTKEAPENSQIGPWEEHKTSVLGHGLPSMGSKESLSSRRRKNVKNPATEFSGPL